MYNRQMNIYCGSSDLLMVLASRSRSKPERSRLAYHSVHRWHPSSEFTGSGSYRFSFPGFIPASLCVNANLTL